MIPVALVRVTPPAVEPVSLVDAKAHLRVDTFDDDTLIGLLISAAREWAEQETQRALITQQWRVSFDAFPVSNAIQPPPSQWDRWPLVGLLPLGMTPNDVIPLPKPPLLSVESVTYIGTDGTPQTLDPSAYVVDSDAVVGRLVRAYNTSWPNARAQRNAITVNYTAGYGPASTDVPAAIRQAMLLAIGDLYENREAQSAMTAGGLVANAAGLNLLAPHRILEMA